MTIAVTSCLIWSFGPGLARADEAEPAPTATDGAAPAAATAAAAVPSEVNYAEMGLTGFEQRLYAGLGIVGTDFLGASSSEGAASLFGTFAGEIHVQGALPVWDDRLFFTPWVSFTPLARAHSDGAGSRRRLSVALEGSYVVFPLLSASLGAGLTGEISRAPGGTVTLANGASTKDFYVPDGNVLSRVFFVDLGLGYRAVERVRADLRFLMSGLGSDRFSTHVLGQLSFGVF